MVKILVLKKKTPKSNIINAKMTQINLWKNDQNTPYSLDKYIISLTSCYLEND